MYECFIKKHLANVITGLRILGIFLIFPFLPFDSVTSKHVVIIMFAGIALTDKLDGIIARSRFGQVTELGKILDPMADKLADLIFLPLISLHLIPAWAVACLFGRHFIVTTIRLWAAKFGTDVSAKFSGKIKTVFSFSLVLLLLLKSPVMSHQPQTLIAEGLPSLHWLAEAVSAVPEIWIQAGVYGLVALSLFSCFDYLIRYSRPTTLTT